MQKKLVSLGNFNMFMAVLHALQGVAVLILSKDFRLPVNAGYLSFDRTSQKLLPATKYLFDVRLSWLIAAFLFISATAHLIIATVYRKKYNSDLGKGINRARWIEYSLSASTMMVAVAMLVGVYDLASLLMIFALVAVMNLCGLVMEIHNQTTKTTNWLSFWLGCLAGIVPWVVVFLYFKVGADNGAKAPDFVYWIFVSIFAFFNIFAINMVLQYKKIGKWHDYLYGERVYIILSLVAKSLLAWQVFAGTLRP